MSDSLLITSLLISLVCGLIARREAVRKNLNTKLGFCLGFFFGVLGLAIVFFLRPKKAPTSVKKIIPPKAPKKEIDATLWYYLDKEHKQIGPMSFMLLQDALEKSKINDSSYVWNEKMDDWKKIEELPEVFSDTALHSSSS